MNLYRIMIDTNSREYYIIEKSMVLALNRAIEKNKQYNYDVIGIWLVENDVE